MTQRNRTSSIFTAAVLFIVSIAVSITAVYTWLPYADAKLKIREHYELWRSGKELSEPVISERVLYNAEGSAVISEIQMTLSIPDTLHEAAEAAIAPLSDKERQSGLISYVPENTRLIGISEKDDYIFIDLSEEMESAGEEAYMEIASSLSLSTSFRKLIFMIEGTPVYEII